MIQVTEDIKDQNRFADSGKTLRESSPLRVILGMILFGLLLNALLIRTQHVSDVTFWFDEACSWKISTLPPSEMFEAIANDVHPPLYYLLLSLIRKNIGDTVETLRGVSIVFGLATVAATWWLLWRAGQDRTSAASSPIGALVIMPVLGAFQISISPFHVDLSHQARPYTIGTFLAVMAAGFALQVSKTPRNLAGWGGFTICCTALSFTHYFCLFTIAGIFLFLALQLIVTWWHSGVSRDFWSLLTGIIFSAWACQLVWLLWWPSFLRQNMRGNQQAWMKPLDWNVISQVCWKVIAGGQLPQDEHAWAFLGPVVWLTVGLLTITLWGRAGRLIGICALSPPIIVGLYGLLVRNILDVRYLAFGHLFFLICCAMLIVKLRPLFLQITAAILIIAWSGTWLIQLNAHREMLAENAGLKQASEYIGLHRNEDEPVFVSHLFGYLSIYRYLFPSGSVFLSYQADHRSGIGSASLREADYLRADEKLKACLPRIWTIDIPNLNGRMYADVLPEGYQLVRKERFLEKNIFVMELIVSEYVFNQSTVSKQENLSYH